MKTAETALDIREFQPGDEAAFRRLNEEWITRYFVLEAKDQQAFSDPQGKILSAGGRIYFAAQHGEALGCCALVAMGPREYEVSKMGVTATAQGRGVGRALLTHVIEAARTAGARRLYIETNSSLAPALRLYASMGFVPVPPERLTPSPYARADVYLELFLQ